jgi:hypothetical protein
VNERKRRLVANEAIFRSVNEQVVALNATMLTPVGPMEVVCECGTERCTDRIPIQADAYEQARGDATLFIVKPGHDFPETDVVTEKQTEYWLVRKHPGEPAELVRETRPGPAV